MTFSQLIAILKARWKAASMVFVLIVGGVVAVSLLLPKKYTATAAVLIDMKSTDPIASLGSVNGMPMGYVATQADIIQSPRVAIRVVRDLKLTDNPQLRAQWMEATDGQGSFEVWVAEALGSKLDVKPSRESSVININYASADAHSAADLANETYSGGKSAMGFSVLSLSKKTDARNVPQPQVNHAKFFANTGQATFTVVGEIDIDRTKSLKPHDAANPVEKLFDW
jgi:uncharacterized protein involved in exopolysaccharide biosynthesis